MTSLSSISLSGMQAAQAALDVSAHNIANLATPAFRRQLAGSDSLAGGGAVATLGRASQPGNAVEADMVDQLVAKNGFLANLAVFKAGDQMMGSLLHAVG